MKRSFIPPYEPVLTHYQNARLLFSVSLPKDLKYIYGRYINPSSEEERNMYVNPSSPSPCLRGAAARTVSTRYF